MRKFKINYKDITQLVQVLVKEQQEEYITLDGKKLREYLEWVNFKGEYLRRFPEIKGKKIIVTGKLDLSNTNIDTLGPIARIENGHIDASRSKLRSWGDLEKGSSRWRVYINRTPLETSERLKEIAAKKAENEELKDNNEWSLENDTDIGNKANALLDFLSNNGYNVLTGEDKEEYDTTQEQLKLLNAEYEETEDQEKLNELSDRIVELEEKLSEYEEYIDLYDLYPNGNHYEMTSFEINKIQFYDQQFAVGSSQEMDESAYDYAKNFIEDTGIEGFRESFLEDCIDVERLLYHMDFDNDVRDNLESHFDDSDKDLSDEQQQKIIELKNKIQELNQRQENLDLEDENYSDNYDKITDEISDLESEIEDIESDPDGEISEEKIQSRIDDLESEVKNDPMMAIRNYGLNFKDYIDEDELVKKWVDADGWGIISSYDGDYHTEYVNDKQYVIIIINK